MTLIWPEKALNKWVKKGLPTCTPGAPIGPGAPLGPEDPGGPGEKHVNVFLSICILLNAHVYSDANSNAELKVARFQSFLKPMISWYVGLQILSFPAAMSLRWFN